MSVFRCGSPLQPSMMMLSLLAAPPAFGADATNEAVFIDPGNIKWQDAPPTLPKGAKIAVLSGNPDKEGPFVIRLRVPAEYKIPPHWHTQADYLTIMSGGFDFGRGEKPNKADEHAMKVGAFHYQPVKALCLYQGDNGSTSPGQRTVRYQLCERRRRSAESCEAISGSQGSQAGAARNRDSAWVA